MAPFGSNYQFAFRVGVCVFLSSTRRHTKDNGGLMVVIISGLILGGRFKLQLPGVGMENRKSSGGGFKVNNSFPRSVALTLLSAVLSLFFWYFSCLVDNH